MNKFILHLFSFLKNCTQFIKILVLFSIMMFILYWIQSLIGTSWAWTSFMNGFLDSFLSVGELMMSGSVMLFAAVFEFKFLAALLLFVLIYVLAHLGYVALEVIEEAYGEGQRVVKKKEEECFNKELENQLVCEQKRLRQYQIYIETQIKKEAMNRFCNVNIDEQNQILIKHLVEKTGVCPEKYENGFLFTFDSFSHIDNMIDIFIKLRESQAPIVYIICVQVMGANIRKEIEQLKTLISLRMINKVAMLSDTAYRYSFNDFCRYETSQLGVFQRGEVSFEVHEFIRKD